MPTLHDTVETFQNARLMSGLPDFVRLCDKEITDTRQLAWTVLAAAAVALTAGVLSEVRARRHGRAAPSREH